MDDSRVIVNLASVEYSRCVEKYLSPVDRFVTCVFGELEGGRVVQKGVYAKMARGDMVRYMAEIGAEAPEQLRGSKTVWRSRGIPSHSSINIQLS